MTAAVDYINRNEELYKSSIQEQKDKEKEKVRGEDQTVTHDDFLQLLVVQMTNQDPLEPMQDTDMMAQFAQMQQLDNQTAMTESMVAMRQEYSVQGASSMIGKEVTTTTENGSKTTGIVIGTSLVDNIVKLTLDNGSIVKYSEVTEVNEVYEPASIQEGAEMMHKYVIGANENAQSVEGIVKNVTTKNGTVYLETYEGEMLPMNGVAQIRELTLIEERDLEEALMLINQYVQAPKYDANGDPDGLKTGVVKDIFRKDGQYFAETWGGQGIYLKDITENQYLTTAQMEEMERCKQYIGRFFKANDGKMSSIGEGFFFEDGEFYINTSRGESVDVDDIYMVRDATSSDLQDYGSTAGINELQLLNLQQAVEDNLGKAYSGFDTEGNPVSGEVSSIYLRNGLILFGLSNGVEAVSPASLIGV